MPYIKKYRRKELDPYIDELTKALCLFDINDKLSGELNYAISRICWQLCGYQPEEKNSSIGERRYARMNTVIGALECAKQELIRRIISPYEDEKIKEEGDI